MFQPRYCERSRGCTEVHFGDNSMSDVLMHHGNNVKLFGEGSCNLTWGTGKTKAECRRSGEQPLQGQVNITGKYNTGSENNHQWAFETKTDQLTIACNQGHVVWNEKQTRFQCSSDEPPHGRSIKIPPTGEKTNEFFISDSGGNYNIDYIPEDAPYGTGMRGFVIHNSVGVVECSMDESEPGAEDKVSCTLQKDGWVDACWNWQQGSPMRYHHQCLAFKNTTEQPQTITHTCHGVWRDGDKSDPQRYCAQRY